MKTMCRTGFGLSAIGACLALAVPGHAQQFIPIEPLQGDTMVVRLDVSANGSVIAGTSRRADSFTDRAFIWTLDGGYVELEPLGPAGTWARAEAISADGTTVVGLSNPQGAACGHAVRWVNGGPPEELNLDPDKSGFGCAGAFAVSGDGNVAAGEGDYTGQFGLMLMGFRWTPETGMVALGGLDPFDIEVIATAVSDDGSTILGLSENGTPQGFRWTKEKGHQGLGYLPGFGSFSVGTAVSADGSIIGGQADIGSDGWAATYWTEDTGWIDIPSIIPSSFVANAVVDLTADGAVMVGYNTGTSPSASDEFIWDQQKGPRSLQTALEDEFGIDLMGWDVGTVRGISSNGNAIVGTSTNPDTGQTEGWIAYLPKSADLNGDGSVGVADLLILINSWGPCDDPADCPADLNNDGTVGVPDLLILIQQWG